MLRFAVLGVGFILVIAGCALDQPRSFDPEKVRQQVLAADDARAACYDRGDLDGAGAYLSNLYVYNDIAANRMTKEHLMARRNEDHRRVIEENVVDFEMVVLSADVVIQRGRDETVSLYYGGLPRRGGSRWMTVWHREPDGAWRIVAEQATEATLRTFPIKVRIELSSEQIDQFVGDYQLQSDPALLFKLRADDGALLATIPGQFSDMVFHPEGGLKFFSVSRPFELEFDPSGDQLTLTTWGTAVFGRRVSR